MAKTTYTIPLRKSFTEAAPKKRTPRAVKAIKAFIVKHCKVEDVKIGPQLNTQLWARGITNPPARVTVDVDIDGAVAKVELEGVKFVEVKKLEKQPESLKDKLTAKIGGGAKADPDAKSTDESKEVEEKKPVPNKDKESSTDKPAVAQKAEPAKKTVKQ